MRVRELKALIANLPDETRVLVPGDDHSYRARIDADIADVVYKEEDGYWGEYYQMVPLEPGEEKVRALVIS